MKTKIFRLSKVIILRDIFNNYFLKIHFNKMSITEKVLISKNIVFFFIPILPFLDITFSCGYNYNHYKYQQNSTVLYSSFYYLWNCWTKAFLEVSCTYLLNHLKINNPLLGITSSVTHSYWLPYIVDALTTYLSILNSDKPWLQSLSFILFSLSILSH